MACQLAKHLGAEKTIARIDNQEFLFSPNRDYFRSIGIDELIYPEHLAAKEIVTNINKKLLAASYIYRYTMNAEVSHVKCLTATDAEALEFIAKEGSKVTKSIISDLDFPKEATIGGFIRNDQGYIASGKSQINPGDKVVVFTRPIAVKKLSKFFN